MDLVVASASAVAAASCASFTDCKSCYDSSLYCHWCGGDSACHAVGSPYGCAWGTSCFNNDQCHRTEPEYSGYATPALSVLLAVGLVGGTLLMCGVATIMLSRDYAKSSERAALSWDAAYEYELMPGDSVAELDDGTSLLPPSAPPKPGAGLSVNDAGNVAEPRARTWRLRRTAPPNTGNSPAHAMTPLAYAFYTFVRFVCGSFLVITLAMCVLVIIYAPHTPQLNVCNTEFDWSSIVHSIKRAGVEADFQLLVSLYNPNRMDLVVKGGSAVFRHHHEEVGEMSFSNVTAEGGYTTDMLLPVTFDAETWENLHLGYEYETGELAFLVDGTITAAIAINSFESYPFSFSFNNYYVRVSDAAQYDRSLCHCPQMKGSNG